MAFRYLADVTTPGAPDEIVDWFATFQNWMTGLVGWTVESGGGTTDLVLSSIGEGPGPPLTMLFLHVYRDGGFPNRVRIEVMNDAVGTQETAEGGYLDGAGAQFAFWMSGDLDAINICFRGGATYHSIYAGMVMPFALTVPDETYRTIVTSTQVLGSILRDSTGAWDVDDAMYDNQMMDDALIDRYDGSFPLGGTFFGRQNTIAGQLKHISGFIKDPAITIMDTLTTGRPGATSTWIVLRDRNALRYAMRTGGVLPAGAPDGSFAAVTGVAANWPALLAALSAHLVGRGWVDLGDPGHIGMGPSRRYFSAGESGDDEIYIGYDMRTAAGDDELEPYVEDDAIGTHHFPNWPVYLDASEFPVNYWICGDRDCCVLTYQRPGAYTMVWSGLVPAFAPGLLPPYAGAVLSPYQLFVGAQHGPVGAEFLSGLLRRHNGAWEMGTASFRHDGTDAENSNPNAYDGTTYMVWPLLAYDVIAPNYELLGQLRYVGYSSGGGIANLDTITIGGQVYTVFFNGYGGNFCVRTV